MNENDRSERPQNRTDAKPCLSDVYKMSTEPDRCEALFERRVQNEYTSEKKANRCSVIRTVTLP